MANVTGTYTTNFKDENGVDLGLQLVEIAYLTAVKANMVPNYILPDAQVSKFKFKSGITTYNLDDIYVRADFWRQGNLLNWGNAAQGGLGTHDIVHRSSPVQTCAGGNNWNGCATGYYNGFGIKSDGTLWSWGRNAYGVLGDGTASGKSSPVQSVTAATTWQSIAAGFDVAAAVKTDGTLWTWGKNTQGALGDNTVLHRSSPVQTVMGGTSWKQVSVKGSVNGSHMGAVTTGQALWLWGYNATGQLGDNSITTKSSPVQTVMGGKWNQVSCGRDHTGAIAFDGTLWMWGRNGLGQLGDNTITHRSSPVQTVSGGTNWKSVSCGYHTAAIKTDGSLWLWGNGASGEIGDNTVTAKSSPVQTITGGNNWSFIAAGNSSTAAIKTDGTLWLWGYNFIGNLGDNTVTYRSSPVQTILGGSAWRRVAMSTGSYTTIALNYLDFPAGTIPAPPPGPTPTPAPAPCWVARLVYGETNPKWMVFRDWLLEDANPWFRNAYLKYGERFAEFIKDMPIAKAIVRSLMDTVVRKRLK